MLLSFAEHSENFALCREYHVFINTFEACIFYKKLRSSVGRQFLKFSGNFATKSFLHVS